MSTSEALQGAKYYTRLTLCFRVQCEDAKLSPSVQALAQLKEWFETGLKLDEHLKLVGWKEGDKKTPAIRRK